MALQWADFPSGQNGLYGSANSFMLDGIYAETTVSLVTDPDGVSGGTVAFGGNGFRYVLSSAQTTVGMAGRYWFASLPVDNNKTELMQWRDAANSPQLALVLQSTGALSVFRGRYDGTLLYTTPGPVITAAAWNHIEAKAFINNTTGTFEVRVNGSVKISLDSIDTCATSLVECSQVYIGNGLVGQRSFYLKDFIVWDGSGSDFNGFQGTVSVRDLNATADVGLGTWAPNVGSTGWVLIADTELSNTLTMSTTIADLDVVRISGTYYKFTTGSVNAGTPLGTSTNPWLVAVGGTGADSLSNLYKAIGATGTAGTTYSTALTAHTTVTPRGVTSTRLTVVPTDGTTTSMTFSVTSSGLSWQSASTLAYGPTDASLIEAAVGATAAEVSFSDLPADTTTVRGLISVTRSYNSDGGDGNLQTSLSPNGTNYTLGANRPLTTAPTFYKDVSTVSPATSTAWTPTEVNSIRIKFNRTV